MRRDRWLQAAVQQGGRDRGLHHEHLPDPCITDLLLDPQAWGE
jgi:hypothetical protein